MGIRINYKKQLLNFQFKTSYFSINFRHIFVSRSYNFYIILDMDKKNKPCYLFFFIKMRL